MPDHEDKQSSAVNIRISQFATGQGNQEVMFDKTADFLVKDTLMDELNISLLNDPILLSKSLKQQFDEVASKRFVNEKEIDTSDYNVEQSLEIFNEQVP